MAIYDLGTASLAANGEVTGVGTTWKAPLTLIRVGATIIFKTNPIKIYAISEIVSDTKINVYNPNSETVPAGTGYAILAHDGITAPGLAQNVAETLRYYQSKETSIEGLLQFIGQDTFDWPRFEQLATQSTTGAAEALASQISAAESASTAVGASNNALNSYNRTVNAINAAGNTAAVAYFAEHGIGSTTTPLLTSLDWQTMQFYSGGSYQCKIANMVNIPSALSSMFPATNTTICIDVLATRGVNGSNVVRISPSTTSNAVFRVAEITITGATGSRNFYVRELLSVPGGDGATGGSSALRVRGLLDVYSTTEAQSRFSSMNYKSTLTSSVERSKESKLGDFVNVMDFGATNNGTLVPLSSKFSTIEAARAVYPFASNLNESLDSVALQAAVNTGKTVYIPKGFMFINRTVRIGNSTRIIGEGTDQINRAQAFISVDGNINLFALVQGDAQNIRMYQVFIEGLYIFYNPGTTPTSAPGNDQKIAFNFVSNVGSATGLENSCIKDCTVHGAWGCYTDTTGTYQTKLQNVWARNCRTGFIKATGTTILLETCYASDCISPYEFGSVMSVTMINCAMDASNISSTSGSYGGAGINFINSHSVNILGMDVEGNIIDTNGSQDCCLIRFNNSNGRISGLTSWKNEVRTTGAGSGGVVSYIKASGTSHVIIDSSEDDINDNGLVYTGSGGYPVTIYAQDSTSRIDVLSGRFQSAKGGSPAISVVSQGNVNWFTEPMGGMIVGGYKQTYSSLGLKTDGVYTGKGAMAVQANVSTGLFELPNNAGLYKVSTWVTGAGANYSVIADVLFDGTTSSITITKTGVFTSMDVSGRTVGITAQGAATYQWTYTKIG
ncbi:lateral tail fiber protein [Veterinaerplatzvirus Jeanpiccard]|uniref:Lateral tail fiber protein n=1 Tax=Escherichia phage JeanPiccard TaxID=2851955 RepID=A0AAE7VVF1_9CAUD|nr:lateral tail fiber protein [Escherichia phage JeanPiccard]